MSNVYVDRIAARLEQLHWVGRYDTTSITRDVYTGLQALLQDYQTSSLPLSESEAVMQLLYVQDEASDFITAVGEYRLTREQRQAEFVALLSRVFNYLPDIRACSALDSVEAPAITLEELGF